MTEEPSPSESRAEPATPATNGVPEGYDLLGENGTVIVKNNRLTIDDATRQALSQQEIEDLKKSSGGKDIIEKILANHAGLEEKTDFSKAKYTLRKTRKYLKRFTVLPVDIGMLMQYITEKEPSRILELREETLGLMLAWSNVHCAARDKVSLDRARKRLGGGRLLVVDDTGGLVVAALAEKMGILHADYGDEHSTQNSAPLITTTLKGTHPKTTEGLSSEDTPNHSTDADSSLTTHRDFPIPAATNTLTILHPAVQPNLSLLKHFGYDTNQPDTSHPLHTRLKPLSWLQLLHPEDDPTYREPELVPPAELQSWKSGKRGAYWKKRRRWERCRSIVDEAREGGFDGLVIASSMEPENILSHALPLVRGGGQVVIYSPTIEPLFKLTDLYSRERKMAYINELASGTIPDIGDFPVDPRLLLAPTLQTSRAREWQVLPGRTHPLMTSRGGSEGYVFTASRVLPLAGGVEAKGNFSTRKRKVAEVV